MTTNMVRCFLIKAIALNVILAEETPNEGEDVTGLVFNSNRHCVVSMHR